MITAVGTLLLGIEEGIMIGVVLSMLMLTYQISYPHIAELGRLPGSQSYRNITRFDNLTQFPHIFIFRFDARLYFANVNYFQDYLLKQLKAKESFTSVILDASSINSMDSSAIHMLHDLIHILDEKNMDLYFVGVRGPVRDKLYKSRITHILGREKFFLTIQEAVDFINGSRVNKHTEFANQVLV